jgi:ribonuclease VapC
MVIDTSAIVAIAFDEPDAASVDVRIANDTVRLISAATVFEASMMLQSRPGEPGGSDWIFGCTGLTPRS